MAGDNGASEAAARLDEPVAVPRGVLMVLMQGTLRAQTHAVLAGIDLDTDEELLEMARAADVASIALGVTVEEALGLERGTVEALPAASDQVGQAAA